MSATADPSATELLIDRAFGLRAEIAAKLLEFEQLTPKIIALGKGKHSGADPAHSVTVVAAVDPSTGEVSYAFPEGIEGEKQARKLADEKFSTFFERIVSYIPRPAFKQIVESHLTPAKARDLVLLCEVPGKESKGKAAYILWPKK